VFQRHIALLKLLHEAVLPSYAAASLNSPRVFAQAHLAARGAAQPTVTLGELARFALPIPPIAEQTLVAERLECMLSRLRTFAETCVKAASLCATLDRSMLAKAFRGDLVPQDPNDEPAGVMLARVRGANGATMNRTKPGPGTKSGDPRRPESANE
jgi:type I restriction enzyme S subunit